MTGRVIDRSGERFIGCAWGSKKVFALECISNEAIRIQAELDLDYNLHLEFLNLTFSKATAVIPNQANPLDCRFQRFLSF